MALRGVLPTVSVEPLRHPASLNPEEMAEHDGAVIRSYAAYDRCVLARTDPGSRRPAELQPTVLEFSLAGGLLLSDFSGSDAGAEGTTAQRAGAKSVGELWSVQRATGTRRVLVVDDEPSMRLLCVVNLQLEGFDVREAADGTEALALAQAEAFDVVLLDVMLPDIGGHEVARRLAAEDRTRDMPIVFLSARAERADLRAGFLAGGVDYVTKPFDPVALGARVGEVLARSERGESEAFRRARLAELEER